MGKAIKLLEFKPFMDENHPSRKAEREREKHLIRTASIGELVDMVTTLERENRCLKLQLDAVDEALELED